MSAWSAMLSMVSPGGRNGRLSILIFHRVLECHDGVLNWDPDANEFRRMMNWVKAWFNVLPLDEGIQCLKEGLLPPRAVAITFDDGYADNFKVALPILKSLGLSATFFIATGYLDGGRMWNDSVVDSILFCKKSILDLSREGLGVHNLESKDSIRKTINTVLERIKYQDVLQRSRTVEYLVTISGVKPRTNLMMTSDQVVSMRRAGMLIGAHTVSHPILAGLEPEQVRNEILGSKQFLEDLIQEPIALFAYPNGKPDIDYRAEDARLVESLGFNAALTTAWGVSDSSSNLMQLPRFTPWDRTKVRFGLRLMNNLRQNGKLKLAQLAQ